jgi:hypothetical protein
MNSKCSFFYRKTSFYLVKCQSQEPLSLRRGAKKSEYQVLTPLLLKEKGLRDEVKRTRGGRG